VCPQGALGGFNLKPYARVMLVWVALLTSCRTAQSQEARRDPRVRLSHVARYIRTHKVPLVADVAVVLANSADAVSTLRAERYCPTCIDYSLGRHPSPAKVWFNTQLSSVVVVPFNHLAYHHYGESGPEPDKFGQKFFVALFSIPTVIHGAADTDDNAQFGPHSTGPVQNNLSGYFPGTGR